MLEIFHRKSPLLDGQPVVPVHRWAHRKAPLKAFLLGLLKKNPTQTQQKCPKSPPVLATSSGTRIHPKSILSPGVWLFAIHFSPCEITQQTNGLLIRSFLSALPKTTTEFESWALIASRLPQPGRIRDQLFQPDQFEQRHNLNGLLQLQKADLCF